MVFTPNSTSIRAAPRLCMCVSCIDEYGKCPLFEEYTINWSPVGNVFKRSTVLETDTAGKDSRSDFIFPDTFVAVVSGDDGRQLRGDKFWLIRVDQTDLRATGDTVDSYGHRIPEGYSYISGHFLERLCDSRKSTIYQEEERTTFFYKENVVYPFVELHAKNFKGKN